MGSYAVRRVLLIFPTLFIASLLLASLVRILPGDVVDTLVTGGRGGSAVQAEEIKDITRQKLGLDAPFYVQYIRWMFGWPKKEGAIYRTTDGGETWKKLAVEVLKPFEQVSFLSPTLGWGLTDKIVYGTEDGGRVWARQYKGDASLNSLFVLDESFGWVLGDNGTILHTSQGGYRQELDSGQLEDTWIPQNSSTDENLIDAAFIDAQTGWVVGENSTIIHTVNGGAEWVAQSSNTGSRISAVAFSDSRSGWVIGNNGMILGTTDGGQSWLPRISGTGKKLNDIAVSGPVIWVVGDGGTILNSRDGGHTWSARPGPNNLGNNLNRVAFENGDNGIIVGDGGLVLATGDGGATWSRKDIALTRREGSETILESPVRDPMKHVNLLVTGGGAKVRAWVTTVETNWKWGVIGGNLGKRFVISGESISEQLLNRLAPSIQLMIMGLILALIVSIPVGIFSAIRQDTWLDYLGRTFAIGGLAIPSFWLGTMLILIPSVYLGWTPPFRYVPFFEDPGSNLYYFMLPSLVVGLGTMAEIMRMTRSMMLEVMRQDYVRTAWSKGLRERAVIVSHALKNAMIPIVTLIGLLVPFLLGELVIIEQIFVVPGIGTLLINGIERRDYPLIQSMTLFLGTIVVVMNLVVDLIYSWLDPRIRYN